MCSVFEIWSSLYSSSERTSIQTVLGAIKLQAESRIASKAIVVILLVLFIVVIPYIEYFGLFFVKLTNDIDQILCLLVPYSSFQLSVCRQGGFL